MVLKAQGYFAVLLAAVAVAACGDDGADRPPPAGSSGGGSAGGSGAPSGGAAGSTGGGTSGAAGSSGGSATGGSSGTGGGGTAGTAGSAGSSSGGGSGGNGGSVTDYVVGACLVEGENFSLCGEYAFADQSGVDQFKMICTNDGDMPLGGCDPSGAVASCVWNTIKHNQPIRRFYFGTWDLADLASGCNGANQTWTVY